MPARICATALKRLGGEHGIDVVYDPVGGPYAEPAVRSMAWHGRYLVIGFAAGEIPKLPLNLVLLQELRYPRRLLGRLARSASRRAQRALMTRHRQMVRAKASSAPMCTRSIRWPTSHPRSKPSATAR